MNVKHWQWNGLQRLAICVGVTVRLGLQGAESPKISVPAPAAAVAANEATAAVAKGHQLFLMNCAHCHGQDATGDEGPDLHDLIKSDGRLAGIITNGIKGEMPKFGQKLHAEEVQELIRFIHSLKSD